jgi:hypothetical protein
MLVRTIQYSIVGVGSEIVDSRCWTLMRICILNSFDAITSFVAIPLPFYIHCILSQQPPVPVPGDSGTAYVKLKEASHVDEFIEVFNGSTVGEDNEKQYTLELTKYDSRKSS